MLPMASGNLGESNDDFSGCSTSQSHHLGGDSGNGELDARAVVIPVTNMVLMMVVVLGLAVLENTLQMPSMASLAPAPLVCIERIMTVGLPSAEVTSFRMVLADKGFLVWNTTITLPRMDIRTLSSTIEMGLFTHGLGDPNPPLWSPPGLAGPSSQSLT